MRFVHGLIAALLFTGTAASAQTQAPADSPAANASTPAPPAPKPKITCRSEQDVGSRLGGTRTCHTAAEWAQIDRDSRLDRTMTGSHGQPHR